MKEKQQGNFEAECLAYNPAPKVKITSFHPEQKTVSRSGKVTTDVTITIKEYVFHAHRDKLIANSSVFKDFLIRNGTDRMKVTGVEPKALKVLLNYMYTNELDINCQNLVEVFRTAQKLRMKKVVAVCIQILLATDAVSAIYLYTVSSQLKMDRERHKSLFLILNNLERCLKNNEYLDLNVDQLCEIITGGFLKSRRCRTDSYYLLFMMALNWIHYKPCERICHAMRVMSCVQFRKMENNVLKQCFDVPVASYITEMPGVKNMMNSAMDNLSSNESDRIDKC